MDLGIFGYIIYGLITGLSEFIPVSTLAHQYLFCYFTGFRGDVPFVKLLVYLGCLGSVILCCRTRLVHIYREFRLDNLPKEKRNRMPDMVAALEARLVLTGLIPIVFSLVFSNGAYNLLGNIVLIAFMLILSGIAAYIPPYFPGGNRDSRSMAPRDGLIFGILSGLSVIPGISRTAAVLCGGRLRGCGKQYILELSFLYSLVMLIGWILAQIVFLIIGGMDLTWITALYGFAAGIAAFIGGTLTIHLMRYLAVKQGFSGFAYYCWGLAVFCIAFYIIT